MTIAAEPVFMVLRNRFARSSLGAGFHDTIHEHHHEIVEAIERGESKTAGQLMQDPLEFLRPTYETLSQHLQPKGR